MSILANYIRSRIKKNKNFMGIILGSTGSGKSWAAMRLAEELDPSFDIDRVVFTATDFMRLINSNVLEKGSVIIYDEAGISMNSRNWYTVCNKMLNYVLQSFRYRCLIIIFTVPNIAFIDSHARSLFHAALETVKIDFKKNQTQIKPLFFQVNLRSGKIYRRYLKPYKLGTRKKITINKLYLDKPSNKLIKDYDTKKEEFVCRLNKDIELELQNYELVPQKQLTDFQKKVWLAYKKLGTHQAVADQLGLERSTITRTLQYARKKIGMLR